MRHLVFVVLPLLALTACQRHDRADANRATMSDAKITIDAGEGNHAVAIKADGASGRVAVNIPGFDANFSVPKAMFGKGNFDIDGVKLYPGSAVKTVNVTDAKSDAPGGKNEGKVRVGFVAPDAPAKVADWFATRFGEKSVKSTRSGNGFSGTTRDGSAFTLALDPGADGKTNGLFVVTDSH
jgi:hypothetical protein